MSKHRTMQHAPCGCVVFYVWDDAETHANRLFTASDPETDDDGLPWTIDPSQRKRVACDDHAGADHHEHFRKLKLDESAEAVRRGSHAVELDAGGGLRFRALKAD